jgi:hypothetical protein
MVLAYFRHTVSNEGEGFYNGDFNFVTEISWSVCLVFFWSDRSFVRKARRLHLVWGTVLSNDRLAGIKFENDRRSSFFDAKSVTKLKSLKH